MELFSPQIRVTTEKYIFIKGLEIEINSNQETAFDWAKLIFVSPMREKVRIGQREKVRIELGYNGDFQQVFTGYATSGFLSGAYENEVLLKDGMLLLESVTINNTFTQAMPQEIIRYCCNQAGVTRMELDPSPYQPLAALPVFRQSGLRTIQSLGRYWRITPKLFFQGDCLYWGFTEKQSKLYHFEHGKNIISLRLADGLWELQTVSVPFVKHSQRIRVTHPTISGDFTVRRLRITTSPRGFIRTTLYFKGA